MTYWSHDLDTDFDPVRYKAPDGIVFVFQRTTDGMYFSYDYSIPYYASTLVQAMDHAKVYHEG